MNPVYPLARSSDPATSVDAAFLAKSLARAHCALILDALREYGPSTAERLANVLPLDKHQIGRRLVELERLGQARVPQKDGKDVTHTLTTGRQARVWEAM